ncbi:MAG TPA: glycosyltransferase family 39 protein [Aggregatilineales bacterium]|nr:DUF2142 domain-containing protein [Anaerolineales bacterium]HRE49336.1 glycosyltransferase family 39 protein [Aggregatilineales bacterium]
MMNRLLKRPLPALLAAYLALATLYSIVTPVFEASDELWHYPMVRYMAQNSLGLPLQTPGVATTWRQEGSQPPLYYMMAALLTGWIDTSDMDSVRRINPHADIGVIVPDENANMTIHNPAVRGFPWRGTALAVHLARFLSVLLGAVTVLMTYRLAAELFPPPSFPPWLTLLAGVFTAFNPMFLFISGSVNNDNLANALAAALLVQIVRLLKRTDLPTLRELIWLGVLAGAGMLAKFNIGFLLPIIALALGMLALRRRDLRFFLRAALVTGGLTILIAGWWYLRNWQLYGDPTGLNVFIQIVGARPIPANAAQLWAERHTFLMSYWGFFGGVNVPLPDALYTGFNLIALIAVGGVLAVGIVSRHTLTEIAAPGRSALLFGRALTVGWIAVLFLGLLRWTSETWASQGRLMFSAIAPLSLWLAVGLWGLGRLTPLLHWRIGFVAGWWFAVTAIFAPLVIARAYDDPYAGEAIPYYYAVAPASTFNTATFREPGSTAPAIELRYSGNFKAARPGQYVTFCATFAIRPGFHLTRDWSLFVHVETLSGVILAQRDVYPGQGLWATSLLSTSPQRRWCNRIAVQIPDYAYVPTPIGLNNIRLFLGFYDLKTGERMPVHIQPAFGRPSEATRVQISTGRLDPRTAGAKTPNPMAVNFGGEIELIGYEVNPSSLTAAAGEAVEVTLYWRRLRPLTNDYRVFVQLLQPNTTNVFAASDAMPAGWSRPTTTWAEGEIIRDTHTLTIRPDAPPETWQIVAGAYLPGEAQTFQRLRIVTPDGGQAEDYVSLARFKILPSP